MSGLYGLLCLAAIHLLANQKWLVGLIWHPRFLSFAAGVSFAYVFIDILPTLEIAEPILKETFGFIPYLNHHAYLMALFGVLFFYGLHASKSRTPSDRNFWLALFGYAVFNFFVGVSFADSTNPDIQPIPLYTTALAMHYFVNDHTLGQEEPGLYQSRARWGLICALFLGYCVGKFTHIPNSLEALVVSFLAGGVLLNVLRYELPKREKVGYPFFVLGSLLYTAIILQIGGVAERL